MLSIATPDAKTPRALFKRMLIRERSFLHSQMR
jgi:hypothetical protein